MKNQINLIAPFCIVIKWHNRHCMLTSEALHCSDISPWFSLRVELQYPIQTTGSISTLRGKTFFYILSKIINYQKVRPYCLWLRLSWNSLVQAVFQPQSSRRYHWRSQSCQDEWIHIFHQWPWETGNWINFLNIHNIYLLPSIYVAATGVILSPLIQWCQVPLPASFTVNRDSGLEILSASDDDLLLVWIRYTTCIPVKDKFLYCFNN